MPPAATDETPPDSTTTELPATKAFSPSSIYDPNFYLLLHMSRKLATNTGLKGFQAIKVVLCARGDPSSCNSTGDALCLHCCSYWLLNEPLLFSRSTNTFQSHPVSSLLMFTSISSLPAGTRPGAQLPTRQTVTIYSMQARLTCGGNDRRYPTNI